MRPLAIALAVALTGLAGCVTPPDIDPATGPGTGAGVGAFDAVRALLADVPCEAESVGAESSANVLDLSVLAFPDGSGLHGEVDAHDAWLLAARYQNGGFDVVSLADPANPVVVASWSPESEGTTYDVKWTPAGDLAVVGFGDRVSVVDVTPVTTASANGAPGTPVLVSEWEYPAPRTFSNMHMLFTHEVGGETFVFVAPNDDTGVWILKLLADGSLETVTNVGEPLGGGPLGPHDMWVTDDEKLGAPVLYVANGFEGWIAWDVSDPASPELLTVVPNVGAGQQYTHSIQAQRVDDRRLVVTVAEVGVNVLRVWDATDFGTPILLAEWWADDTAPHKPQHNVQIVNGTLFTAHYGQGVFAFDLSALGDAPLQHVTGSFAPVAHWAVVDPDAADDLGFSDVWDVVVQDGLLYVTDMESGLYQVGYGCFPVGDRAFTSSG